jgi:uncharacterized protein (DUF2252 family)
VGSGPDPARRASGRAALGMVTSVAHPGREDATVPQDDRADVIVGTLQDMFSDIMQAAPDAFRTKFRKMARDPFAFFRGSAALFWRDLGPDGDFGGRDEGWMAEHGDRVWIQGDLHAENFGTYMDADGRLVFDVNDFDEAYLGPWTWDLRRFVASLALLCWQKAMPDEVIDDLVDHYVRCYVDQVDHYVGQSDDTEWALTLDNADGAVLGTLQQAKLRTRATILDPETIVENYRRRFAESSSIHRLDDDEEQRVRDAFERYMETIPEDKRVPRDVRTRFRILDVVRKTGIGIGSAGLPMYSVLIEGSTQALGNDVVISVKQANAASLGRVIDDEQITKAFEHHGHRTAVSQRALQAHADRYLGWTDIDGTGYVVSEYSPYELDLEWDDLNTPEGMQTVVDQLGRATAKIHCVADDDSATDLVTVSVEDVIAEGVHGDVDGLVDELTEFARTYAEQVRADHHTFVDAFRGGAFSEVAPVGDR